MVCEKEMVQKSKRRVLAAISGALLMLIPTLSMSLDSIGWSLAGEPIWQDRTGPGIGIFIGGNDCTDAYCHGDDYLKTSIIGSAGATVGFFYRFFPILAVFVDVQAGYLNTNYSWLEEDYGVVFQAVAGAEFHAPINSWAATYLGFGMGYCQLSSFGKSRAEAYAPVALNETEYEASLKGVDFEFKVGVDFYVSEVAPTFGFGPIFRLGFPYWVEACVEGNGCGQPTGFDTDKLPFLVFVGLGLKYGF